MSAHNFDRLSCVDFEELIHDLLESEWKVRLESFKVGRDRGIDLRHTSVDGGSTVVQCKHYLGSGFSKLLSHLRDDEYPKVARLNPIKYVLVTSVPLSPDNKERIAAVLHPYIREVHDVWGGGEIEALLRTHTHVETAHYKLWLTSTGVLQRVLHNAERCQTEFRIEKINRMLPLFVQNAAYPRALKSLQETRLVVISGSPGIGKSTLAEMLMYAHLEDGYEPVVMQSTVAEGKKLYRTDRKQVFYFDDFLGEISLDDRPEYFGTNQDAALADFIELVAYSKQSRLILTTREHILSGGLQLSERLRHSGFFEERCLIELADYSRAERARILYNHIYFSDLPASYKEALVAEDFFLKVVDHANFNPRIIEWLAAYTRVARIAPDRYQSHAIELLDRPERIWSQAFNSQISEHSRNILVALFTLGGGVEIVDLEPAWSALHYHGAHHYNYATSPSDFRSGLKELDGSFVRISNRKITFLNPSVRDFMASELVDSRERIRDILLAAIRFRQVADLWRMAADSKVATIRTHLLAEPELFVSSLDRLLVGPYIRWDTMGAKTTGTFIDYYRETRVKFAIELSESLNSEQSFSLLSSAFDAFLEGSEREWLPVSALPDLIKGIVLAPRVRARCGERMIRSLTKLLFERIEHASAADWLSILGLLADGGLWSEAEASLLREGFAKYQREGAEAERHACVDGMIFPRNRGHIAKQL